MTESTNEYKKRIEEIKQSIENEPYMAKMREDIAEGISKTGIRQATVEEQFQAVLDETTGKDVISAPELIAARNGKSNLKTRLDDEHAEVTAQLAENTQQLNSMPINICNNNLGLGVCVGDGIFDNSDIMQSIINYAGSNRCSIYIPKGVYKITKNIYIPNGVLISGDGSQNTIIECIGSGFILNGHSTGGVYNIKISSLTLKGDNTPNSVGINFKYCRESNITDVQVVNFYDGMYLFNSWSNTIQNSFIWKNSNNNITLNAQSNDIKIYHCIFDSAIKNGIVINGESQGVSIVGCTFQKCGENGIVAEIGRNIVIENCYFENNGTSYPSSSDINMNGSISPIRGVVLKGCIHWVKNVDSAIKLSRVNDISILGNTVFKLDNATTTKAVITANALTYNVVITCLYKGNLLIEDNANCIVDITKGTNFNKNRKNVTPISNTLDITDGYRIVTSATSGADTINVNTLIGGVDGQEIFILNTLGTIVLVHGGNIKLIGGVDKTLKQYEGIALICIGTNWYQK